MVGTIELAIPAGQVVLVQREMECGRSLLVSTARASAGRVPRPNVRVTSMRKQRSETQLASERDQGDGWHTGQRNRFALSIHVGWGLTAESLIVEAKGQLATKRISNLRVAKHVKVTSRRDRASG